MTSGIWRSTRCRTCEIRGTRYDGGDRPSYLVPRISSHSLPSEKSPLRLEHPLLRRRSRPTALPWHSHEARDIARVRVHHLRDRGGVRWPCRSLDHQQARTRGRRCHLAEASPPCDGTPGKRACGVPLAPQGTIKSGATPQPVSICTTQDTRRHPGIGGPQRHRHGRSGPRPCECDPRAVDQSPLDQPADRGPKVVHIASARVSATHAAMTTAVYAVRSTTDREARDSRRWARSTSAETATPTTATPR